MERKTPDVIATCQDCHKRLSSPIEKHDLVDCIEHRFLKVPRILAKGVEIDRDAIGAIQILIGYLRAAEAKG